MIYVNFKNKIERFILYLIFMHINIYYSYIDILMIKIRRGELCVKNLYGYLEIFLTGSFQ